MAFPVPAVTVYVWIHFAYTVMSEVIGASVSNGTSRELSLYHPPKTALS